MFQCAMTCSVYRTGRRIMLFGFFVTTLFAVEAGAQTLAETLALAYSSNPEIRAARASLRVADESVSMVRSAWRPTVMTTLSLGATYIDRDLGRRNDLSAPVSVEGTVRQPLYRGGRAKAALEGANHDVQSARASMFDVEQKVLLAAAQIYVDTIRDKSVLELQVTNLKRLEKQMEATRDRFAVGEVTRTDVAQAESRVARAEADLTLATGNLVSSKVRFLRIVGVAPADLIQPTPPSDLPESRGAAVEIAIQSNFALIRAIFEERSANDRISEAAGALLPSADLIGRLGLFRGRGGADQTTGEVVVEAELKIPIYQGGVVSSQVRSAKETANLKRILVEVDRRTAVEQAARAYEAWTTAVARTRSIGAEVHSADIALEGVRQEAEVGARTVLDVLDAEQELLDAQVSLVRAKRNAFVTAYELLAAVGRLTAERLALPVQIYDHDSHYRAVRDRFTGSDISGALP